MKDLTQLRLEIDALDKELMALLQQRMELVKAVGMYKKQQKIAVVDMNRWNQVLESKLQLAKECGLDETMVKDIYNRIHEAAIAMEEKLQ